MPHAVTRAHFISLARSKLRLCSANHRAGYFSNLACNWLSIVWAYSREETESGPRSQWLRNSVMPLERFFFWLQDIILMVDFVLLQVRRIFSFQSSHTGEILFWFLCMFFWSLVYSLFTWIYICHAQYLWNLAWSCKRLCSLKLFEPVKIWQPWLSLRQWFGLELNTNPASYPDSKHHGANMGPTLVLSAPNGPHVGLMNLAIWVPQIILH